MPFCIFSSLFFISPQPHCASLHGHIKDSLKKDRTGKKLEAIKLLFSQCTVALKEESNVRIANALFTMCLVSKSVLFKKKKQTYDAFEILIGRENLDVKLEILRSRLCELLFSESTPNGSKALILEFLLVLVTASTNLDQNPLVAHLMSDHLFDAFVSASLTLTSRHVLGFKALLLLTLLVNYKKQEKIMNPFIVKLSLIHDEVVLNAFAHVICSEFCDFNRTFEEKNEGAYSYKSGGSIFSSITNMVGQHVHR